MEFVKDHHGNAFQGWVFLNFSQKETGGGGDDSGRFADSSLVSDLIANFVPDCAASFLAYSLCGSPGGHPSWFKHIDALTALRQELIEQIWSHSGGLAGPRLGF
ncbi:MAG: hypothetical protein BWY75_02692 [bacterium ADurb.Bin425]|nr:MAG: hypothetical protein BWY75_02692 [bacterium ADurb.Bin425]